ncbi:hypothetical protein R3P38DRAFT_2786679 [Favolaschia claudopus]|uniref:Uncharacterized protein n=1 Tax=Favolaschia claudopus TaxID=2862362 RepID=A0AAW0AQX9_9AGAR
MFVLPGDPNTDAYNDHLPDEQTSMVYAVGRINGGPQTLNDAHNSRFHNVDVPDYVRGQIRSSSIHIPMLAGRASLLLHQTARFNSSPRPVTPAKRGKFDPPTPPPTSNDGSVPVASTKRRKFDVSDNSSASDDASTASVSGTAASAPTSTTGSTPGSQPSRAPVGHVLSSPPVMSTLTSPESIQHSPFPYLQPYYAGPPPQGFMPSYYPTQNPYHPGLVAYQPPYAPFSAAGEYLAHVHTPATPQKTTNTHSRHPASPETPTPVTTNESAYHRSAANPYSHPMTQIPPERRSDIAAPASAPPASAKQSTSQVPTQSSHPSTVTTSTSKPSSFAATSTSANSEKADSKDVPAPATSASSSSAANSAV